MITIFHEKPLSEYGNPETMTAMMGIKNPEIGKRIVGSRYLTLAVEASLVPPFEETELSVEHADVVQSIVAADLDLLRAVSRLIAVLTQHHHLSRSANGELLRLVVDFTGDPRMVKIPRKFNVPVIGGLPPLKKLDREGLEEIAEFALGFLLGLLPEPILARYAFQFPVEDFPNKLELGDSEDDLKSFISMARVSFFILTEAADEED